MAGELVVVSSGAEGEIKRYKHPARERPEALRPTKNPATFRRAWRGEVLSTWVRLQRFDAGREQAFGSALDFKLDALTFLQSTKAFADDRFEMNEHFLSIVALDEAITFGIIEPLDSSSFHSLDDPFC